MQTSRRLFIALVSVWTLGLVAYSVQAADGPDEGKKGTSKAEKPAFPQCPVMGESIDFSVSLATKEGPVYFCCPKCIKKYKADTKKYADKVAAQRKIVAALPKVQVTCPLTGEPVDDKVMAEYNGRKVYFCCDKCIGKYKKSPAKYEKKLASSFTYQVTCPVSGEPIAADAFLKMADGKTVYFCCPKCKRKFTENPEKYVPKLEAQGTIIDPDMVKSAKKDEHGEHEGHGSDGHAGHDH